MKSTPIKMNQLWPLRPYTLTHTELKNIVVQLTKKRMCCLNGVTADKDLICL